MKRQQLLQSKSRLAIALSKLGVFEKFGKPQLMKEQLKTAKFKEPHNSVYIGKLWQNE